MQSQNGGPIGGEATTGELELKLQPGMQPGIYSFYVVGIGQMPVTRDPDLLKSAQERKAAVENIAAEAATTAKATATAKTAADQQLGEARAAAQRAAEAVKVAAQTVVEAQSAAADSQAKLEQARAAVEKIRAMPNLKISGCWPARGDECALKVKAAVDAQTAAEAAAKAAAEARAASAARATAEFARTKPPTGRNKSPISFSGWTKESVGCNPNRSPTGSPSECPRRRSPCG